MIGVKTTQIFEDNGMAPGDFIVKWEPPKDLESKRARQEMIAESPPITVRELIINELESNCETWDDLVEIHFRPKFMYWGSEQQNISGYYYSEEYRSFRIDTADGFIGNPSVRDILPNLISPLDVITKMGIHLDAAFVAWSQIFVYFNRCNPHQFIVDSVPRDSISGVPPLMLIESF